MDTIAIATHNPYLDASANKQGPQTCRFHFNVGQKPGELKRALDILASHKLSISNIESQVGDALIHLFVRAELTFSFSFLLFALLADVDDGNVQHFRRCGR